LKLNLIKYKKFGNSVKKVSEIGMGTYYDPLWILTSRFKWLRGKDDKLNALKAGIDSGINLIDTAELYGSEPIVAEAINGYDREELFISTKILPYHLKGDKLLKSLESSLRRLGTKYVDVYLIHWHADEEKIREAMVTMEKALEMGLIKMIGLSNFNLTQIESARHYLKKNDIGAVQLEYNIFNRKAENDILPFCEKNNIAFMAYYPLAHGKLTNNAVIIEIAKEIGVTPAQLALKWLLKNPSVFPIPRASKIYHVLENSRVSDFELDQNQLSKLNLLHK